MIPRLNAKRLVVCIFVLTLFSVFIIYNKISNLDSSNDDKLKASINNVPGDIHKHREARQENQKSPVNVSAPQQNIKNNDPVEIEPVPESRKTVKYLQKRPSDIEMIKLYEKIKYLDEDGGVWKQGWQITPEKPQGDPLIVIVTPHSHQDPGWIYTFEDYFSRQTKISLDKTFSFLNDHPDAKFIYAEISFFSLWWASASSDQKQIVRNLIKKDQLEFVTGGWVMNDEANTHAFAMIDQLTEGQQWLLENLDYRPRSGWQIDPFGHSNTMGFLARKANLSRILIQRTHYEIKKELAREKNLEFNWIQSWDKTGKSSVFVHMMPFYSYDVPHTCGPDPSVCCQFDFIRISQFSCPWFINPQIITESNLKERSETLLDQYYSKSSLYKSHNVLFVPLGDDFRYRFDNEWNLQYDNYKKIMDYINSNKEKYNAEIKFGTLSDYFDKVTERMSSSGDWSENFASLQGDMFTYADRVKDYWSGYFTSRPLHKRLTRIVEAQVRLADILYSLGHLKANSEAEISSTFEYLTASRRNLGLFQHHDGITGTAKPDVVKDYEAKLETALKNANYVQEKAIQWLFKEKISAVKSVNNIWNDLVHTDVNLFEIDDLNGKFELAIFSPNLIWSTDETIKIRIKSSKAFGQPSEIPVIKFKDDPTRDIPLQVEVIDSNIMEISFNINYGKIKGLSFKIIVLTFAKSSTATQFIKQEKQFSLSNNRVKLIFDSSTGMLTKVVNLKTQKEQKVQVNLEYYSSSKSGAYLFIPNSEKTQPYNWKNRRITHKQGPIYDEIHVEDSSISHRYLLPKNENVDGFEIVNSVLLDSSFFSIDLVMTISTEIENNRNIYTDSNCYQLMQRPYIEKIPVQGNVYPMPCTAFIQESANTKKEEYSRMTMITSHPVGVLSAENGKVSLWLDRRSDTDDERGLGQGVTDNQRIANKIKIILETVDKALASEDIIPSHSLAVINSIEKHLNPLAIFSINTSSPEGLLTSDSLIESRTSKLEQSYRLINLKTFHSKSEAFKKFTTQKSSQIGFVLHKTYHHDSSRNENDKKINIVKDIFGETLTPVGYSESSITLIPDPQSTVSLVGKKPELELDNYDIQGYLLTF